MSDVSTPETQDQTLTARPILDLPKPAADYLLGRISGLVGSLIPVQLWNRLVAEAEADARRAK